MSALVCVCVLCVVGVCGPVLMVCMCVCVCVCTCVDGMCVCTCVESVCVEAEFSV